MKLGPTSVPVLARGNQYVFGQNLDDVAEFVGLAASGQTPLAPEILIKKWMEILRAASRYVRQLPPDRLGDRAVETRDRSIRLLSHHIFRIAEAFLEVAIDGVEYRAQLANVPPEEGTYVTGSEIAGYGETVTRRLQQWWDGLSEKSCRHTVKTFYGDQPTHQLLERSTWHSAQHTRQMIAVLERLGIAVDQPLTADDYAGLPLPEGLWD